MHTCPFHAWNFPATAVCSATPFPRVTKASTKASMALAACRASPPTAVSCSAPSQPTVLSLEEHLGGAAGDARRVCLLARGRDGITSGFLKHRVRRTGSSSWRTRQTAIPAFVHSSIFSVADSADRRLYGAKSTRVDARLRQRPYGTRPAPGVPQARRAMLSWFGTTPEKLPDYVSRMNAAYGESGRAKS